MTGMHSLGVLFKLVLVVAVFWTLLCSLFLWRLVYLLRSPDLTRRQRLLYRWLLALAVLLLLPGLYLSFHLLPVVGPSFFTDP